MTLPLAITMGDPAGIGPEIVAKAFAQEPKLMRGSFVAGDVACMRRAAAWIADGTLPMPVALIDILAALDPKYIFFAEDMRRKL